MDTPELCMRAGTSQAKLERAASAVSDRTGYTKLHVPKREGGTRIVERAIQSVDKEQTAVKTALSELYAPLPCVHGYVKGRDNYTNAAEHLGQAVVLRVDLKSFFSSITRIRIANSLREHGLDRQASDLVLGLSCVDGVLATGFPTSPTLANMAFSNTDRALMAVADAFEVRFTRYGDDLVFSGSDVNDGTLSAIRHALEEHSWIINDGKTRFMRLGGPQYVTGPYVGLPDRPRIPRRMKRRLRQQIHYLSAHGYENCHNRVHWTMGERRLSGWINYISRVEPALGVDLRAAAADIDWDRPRPIGFDDEWDEWLAEIGVPDNL